MRNWRVFPKPVTNGHVPVKQLEMSFPNHTDSNFPDNNFECSGMEDSVATASYSNFEKFWFILF